MTQLAYARCRKFVAATPELDLTTGADLRAARTQARLSLASVAATCGVSAGHLSRIETGQRSSQGVSPAIVAGYERALGQQIAATAKQSNRATVDDVHRRHLLGLIATASVGAAREPLLHLVDGLVTPERPSNVGEVEVAAVDAANDLYTKLDLAFGGGLAAQVAHGSLRWAVRLLDGNMTEDVRSRLCSAVAALADRAAWSTYDTGNYTAASRLWTLALDTSARGRDRDLRAHILLNFSTLLADTEQGPDAVETLRLALGDERVSPTERANLHAVCARHAAGIGERQSALRHLGLADDALSHATPETAPPWARRVTAASGHFDAAIGMAWHALDDRDRAHKHLTAALSNLDRGRTRTRLRCSTRLAVLHLRNGDTDAAIEQALEAIAQAPTVRSQRVRSDLAVLRDAARQRGLHDLAAELDGVV